MSANTPPPMSDEVREAVEAIHAADDELALRLERELIEETPKGPVDGPKK